MGEQNKACKVTGATIGFLIVIGLIISNSGNTESGRPQTNLCNGIRDGLDTAVKIGDQEGIDIQLQKMRDYNCN